MIGFKGAKARRDVLDAQFGSAHTIGPTTFKLRLYTTAPTIDTAGVEVAGIAYAELSIDNDGVNFAEDAIDGIDPLGADEAVKHNTVDWDFGQAGGDWGTITAAVLVDPADGSYFRVGKLDTAVLILEGDFFKIPIGGFKLTEK